MYTRFFLCGILSSNALASVGGGVCRILRTILENYWREAHMPPIPQNSIYRKVPWYIILYWNSSACARAARNLHATNLRALVCVFSVNFQNSEFRICIPLYMCIFSQFSETCYLIFWCMFLKIDWKYTYKGGMLILNSEFWTLTENTYILAGAHCMNLQIHQFSDQ